MTNFSFCEYVTIPLGNELQLGGDTTLYCYYMFFSEVLITVTYSDEKWQNFLHRDPYPSVSSSNLSAPFNKTFLKYVSSDSVYLFTVNLYHIIIIPSFEHMII